ncbi:MAG: hypothetical protein R3E86_16480 [Pseudomonadales bacterium]
MKLTTWSDLVKPQRAAVGAAALACLLTALGLLGIWSLTSTTAERVARYGAAAADSLAALAVEPMLDQDRLRLGVLGNRFAELNEIRGVATLAADGTVLTQAGTLGEPEFTADVTLQGEIMGSVRLALNPAAFADGLGSRQRSGDMLRWVLGAALLLLVPFAAASALAVGHAIASGEFGRCLDAARAERAASVSGSARTPAPADAADAGSDGDADADSGMTGPAPCEDTLIRHYLVAINLHNQLSLDSAERDFELSLCYEIAEEIAHYYQGQVAQLPGTGVLVDFDHTDTPTRPQEVLAAAAVAARLLLQETGFGSYRIGVHVTEVPADETLALDDPAVADAALISALGKELKLALTRPFADALQSAGTDVVMEAARNPLLEQLSTCPPECLLVTELALEVRSEVLEQVEYLGRQRDSTARESTF